MSSNPAVVKYRKTEKGIATAKRLNGAWYASNPQYALWRNAKKRAKELGLAFDLEWRTIVVPEICPLLNIPLAHAKGKLNDNSPSIDRIDCKGGYTKDNTWIVSFRANSIKRNSNVQEFETLLENWKKKLGQAN